MATDVEPVRKPVASHIGAGLLSVILLLLIGAANVPMKYVEVGEVWQGAVHMDYRTPFQAYRLTPTMAGWPFTFWVQYPSDDTLQTRLWSTPKLLMNIAIMVGVPLAIFLMLLKREQQPVDQPRGRRSRKLYDLAIAAAILVVPGLYVAWQLMESRQHRLLAQHAGRFGNIKLSCMLPEKFVDNVPQSWFPTLRRIRDVHLLADDQRLRNGVAELKTLVAYHALRERIDPSIVHVFQDHIHLQALQLSWVDLEPQHAEAIAQLSWLRQLNLARTNLTTEMFRKLDHMPLKSIDVSVTNVPLAELGNPQWSATVEQLSLSRPISGSDSLVIDGWPSLKTLSISRFTLNRNHDLVDVRLANLPNLESLSLNRTQKHHLVLHNLPRLARLDEGMGNTRFIMNFADWIPGGTWVTGLELHNVPSITSFACYAADLEELSIQDAPNLHSFSIGSFLTRSMGQTGLKLEPVKPHHCQQWIDLLGNRTGPGTIDFTGLPLTRTDLSPLAKNARIRHLNFESSGVTFEQLKTLQPMKQLESLDIRSCQLDEQQLAWLLDEFPNLEQLSINGRSLEKVDFSGSMRLSQVRTTPLSSVRDVRIVDLPDLTTNLRISRTPERMEIRNAFSLRGLAVEGLWPKNATLTGLRDLKWFAGGGPELNDAVMDVLLNCQAMEQLTLAYPSISKAKLEQIGRLETLTLLAVPGADVDDSVTEKWSALETLWDIDLNDTAVSAETIGWLSRLESLRRVSLNRVPLNADAIEALAELPQISELQLSQVPINASQLDAILRTSNLRSLDLSGVHIDDQMADALQKEFSLKHLKLDDGDIDQATLVGLLEANQDLYVDFTSIPGFVRDDLADDLASRASKVLYEFRIVWQDMLTATDGLSLPAENDATDSQPEPGTLVSISMPYSGGRIDATPFRFAD